MRLILIGVGILLVPTLVVAGLIWVGLRVAGRNPDGYWKKTMVLHAILVPIHAFLVIPAALGFLAPRFVNTRPDEQAYAGSSHGNTTCAQCHAGVTSVFRERPCEAIDASFRPNVGVRTTWARLPVVSEIMRRCARTIE